MAKLTACKTCGKEVAKSAKKCPHCGAKLKMGFFKKALIGIGALIVIGIVANLGSGDESNSTSNTKDTTAASASKETAAKPLSNKGVSSNVTIKVNGVQTKQELGNQFSKEKAQGVFKIVEVSITNGQKDAITVDSNSFKLVDSKDREFTSSTEGQSALDMENGGDSDFFLKQLNPGLTQTGKIVFDVPADAKGLTLKATGGMTGEEITLKVD